MVRLRPLLGGGSPLGPDVPESDEERLVMTAAKGSSKSQVLPHHSAVRMSNGLLDLPIAPIRFIYFQNGTRGCYCGRRSPLRCEKRIPSWSLWRRIAGHYVKNHTSRTGDRVESHAAALVLDRRTDQRRSTDGSQIVQPKFVAEHGCFTVGGR